MSLKFATVFRDFEAVHLTKDVGMIPIAMSKIFDSTSKIYYWSKKRNEIINNDYKGGVELSPIIASSRLGFLIKVIIALLKDDVKYLNVYHLKNESFLLILFSRIFFIKTYLKLDMSIETLNKFYDKKISMYIYRLFIEAFFRITNIISVESEELRKKLHDIFPRCNIIYLPNGIAKETIPESFFKKNSEKENVFLVVGRIGAFQKNHEVIIHAISKVKNFKNWKVKFVGPVDKNFLQMLDDFFENDSYRSRFEFLGNKSREELFSLYENSRVFLLPSRWEGFSIALLEAAYMGCYIVATDVGGVREVSKNGEFSTIIKGCDNELADVMQSIIDGTLDTECEREERKKFLAQEYDLEKNLRGVNWQ
ncbi:glycosyltransferase family 4 protein [Pectobacterium brasiliense]|uniref:glycosyltransferase family 4 protein n=1 Tax=Pectobacterium brasiliense TaxID=180957 RepID=UPI001B39BC23|nr:glycosyltransferase family 4 protein [Pectobacterium brasiliense]MBQ4794600.1 glycosyltransferase [Pectobacterium versatile]MCA5918290.1 glycosyltransferase family 4 protein [Pectobacterium brasiliense]MCA5926171.1 glycosyltransferase family 4 protein [Pectobacterium brasiliense]MCA5934154.1 glycosyltransferase family 4 protein [Pectobacterium brasiliense]MCA5938336.1 glycosyltransferase family 4 protein [Pectobacterium brasiliense]